MELIGAAIGLTAIAVVVIALTVLAVYISYPALTLLSFTVLVVLGWRYVRSTRARRWWKVVDVRAACVVLFGMWVVSFFAHWSGTSAVFNTICDWVKR
jgi:hypothetical protein